MSAAALQDGAIAVVLASASRSRARMLAEAGVSVAADPAQVDEAEIKNSLAAEQATPAQVAETLAELKARRVSQRRAGALVIGADQVLDLEGALLDKPRDRAEAAAHLRRLSGRTHRLISAVCAVRDDGYLWHAADQAQLTMRPLSDAFIEDYLAAVGARACESVGAYQLEGLGAQLFSRVEGDFFTVLGLPLLPLLDFLRAQKVLRP
ncbi:MAG: Maf family protein [Kiloniellales bacterium]|nr:Maf family protein [Kiloniellales bacterium]